MKRLIQLLTVLSFGIVYSQFDQNVYDQPVVNTQKVQPGQFEESGTVIQQPTVESEYDFPADPPAPLPIDDYLPVLLLVGIGLVFYQKNLKKYRQA